MWVIHFILQILLYAVLAVAGMTIFGLILGTVFGAMIKSFEWMVS